MDMDEYAGLRVIRHSDGQLLTEAWAYYLPYLPTRWVLTLRHTWLLDSRGVPTLDTAQWRTTVEAGTFRDVGDHTPAEAVERWVLRQLADGWQEAPWSKPPEQY